MRSKLSILLLTFCPIVPATAQTLSINEPNAPTNAIVVQATQGSYTRTFHNHATQQKTTRGNSFLVPDTGDASTEYRVTGLTLRKNTTQTFETGDQLQVWIFAWDPTTDGNDETNWILGNGTSDGDPLSGTGMTALFSDTFPLDGLSFTANQYFTIDLNAAPLTFNENAVYGFLIGFMDGDDGTGTYFQLWESGGVGQVGPYADGRQLRTWTDTVTPVNTTYAPRDVVFWVSGSTLDSGIVNPTISASAELIEIGALVDLDISFDTSVDTATLSTLGGPVDLKALDAGDAVPGDGMVEVTDSPTSTYTYEVLVTKAGETDESAQAKVMVADPSAEAADNAFSTAIKGDLPLFYYRFEEDADTGFLLDSSGNGHHAHDILGSFAQGAGPGGMQKAGECPGDVSILVPATSTMNQSFTVTAVVNLNGAQPGGLRSIFSMADGNDIGRSILYFGNDQQLRTYIDGTPTLNAGGTVPPSDTSVLYHMVFDADPDENPGTEDQEVRFYINGQLESGAGVPVGTVAANVGQWVLASVKGRGSQFLNEWLDETAVFESVFTDAQIEAHGTAFFAAADPLLGFTSDTVEVDAGGPVTLTWTISDRATAVTINGVPETISGGGLYTTMFNPTVDTTYTLEVSGPDGPFTRMIQVTVLVPEGGRILSISAVDGLIEPDITIQVMGAPNTTYDITNSTALRDGFLFPVSSVTTDDTGVGTTTFSGLGPGEFYRLELP